DKILLNEKQMMKSLDPMFMHRIVVGPIHLELDEDGEIPAETPLPPIIVNVIDKDKHFGTSTFFVMGKATVLHPVNFDAMAAGMKVEGKEVFVQDGKEKKLDLNTCHTPIWFALDAQTETPFWRGNRSAAIDVSWLTRPRVLMAVGFSSDARLVPKDASTETSQTQLALKFKGAFKTDDIDGPRKIDSGYISQIQTEKNASYKISIDILGLRNLPNNVSYFSSEELELVVTSSWEGPELKLNLSDHKDSRAQNGNKDLNFRPTEDSKTEAGLKKAGKLMGSLGQQFRLTKSQPKDEE
ncbi:unnamed protein product, partial [Polarella glacialis]